MGLKETGCKQAQGTYNWPPSQIETRTTCGTRALKQYSSNKLEIELKEKSVGTLRSQVHHLDGLPMRCVVGGWCMGG